MIATWPRQRPAAAARAVIKAVPEDFRVVELPEPSACSGEPSAGHEESAEDAGEHLYLRLEKTGLATAEVAVWLAEVFGVPEFAVGYAGMKDKHAITEQWFSVQTRRDATALPERPDVRLRGTARRARKLRRGQLAGNRFRVCLREVAGDGWCERLAAIREHGAPNYFGPQRFGRDNLARARDWLRRRPRHGGRGFRRGLHLSVLRSFLFNEVLGFRVNDGSWNELVEGDVPVASAWLDGQPEQRLAPSGPLWGRGRSSATGAALEMEQAALAPHADLRDGLEHAGLVHERRSLVLRPADLRWQVVDHGVELAFSLPPGSYATSLLTEVFELVQGQRR